MFFCKAKNINNSTLGNVVGLFIYLMIVIYYYCNYYSKYALDFSFNSCVVVSMRFYGMNRISIYLEGPSPRFY